MQSILVANSGLSRDGGDSDGRRRVHSPKRGVVHCHRHQLRGKESNLYFCGKQPRTLPLCYPGKTGFRPPQPNSGSITENRAIRPGRVKSFGPHPASHSGENAERSQRSVPFLRAGFAVPVFSPRYPQFCIEVSRCERALFVVCSTHRVDEHPSPVRLSMNEEKGISLIPIQMRRRESNPLRAESESAVAPYDFAAITRGSGGIRTLISSGKSRVC